MMYLQDVTLSRKVNGTSSSGVLPKNYGKEWGEKKERNATSKLECGMYHVSSGTTGTETPNTFLIFQLRDCTTANVILDLSSKEIIRYWQHEKLLSIEDNISKQFFAIRQRKENWDGLGSKKPNRLSLSNAEGIIKDFLISVIEAGDLWLTPFIFSDEDGNITIEWHRGQYELHIEVREDEAEYIKVWGTNIESEMHLDFLDNSRYLILWEWLLRG